MGLDNYLMIFSDAVVRKALLNTVYYVVFMVFIVTVLSLIAALIINRITLLVSFYKVVYFLPAIVSLVAISQLWMWMYNPRYGLINHILSFFKIPAQSWLLDEKLAMPSVIIMSVWKSVGFFMIIFLAGLKNIPEEYYEAAKIDGASSFQITRKITLPLLKPIALVVIVTATISSFLVFTQVFVMTQGGPIDATQVIVYQIYVQGFLYFKMGYASAIAYVLFMIVLSLTLLQLRILRE